MRELRDAWSRTITAEDYEAHMAAIGQAQANAALVAEYLQAQPPSRHASVLFAGAGTGQMFEYVSPEILLPLPVVVRQRRDRPSDRSALLTTTMPNMGKTIDAFIDADLREEVKIMVGGAPVTQEFADDMGADGYGKDAVAAVELAKQLVGVEARG